MPIYDIQCDACGYRGELLVPRHEAPLVCPSCGGLQTTKHMAPTSGLTGRSRQARPGPGDTACCGQRQERAGCQGPGSCCGRH